LIPLETREKTASMRAKTIAVAKVMEAPQSFGIAFAATAHIASMTDNVVPRHP
jgi:hypothetical protein